MPSEEFLGEIQYDFPDLPMAQLAERLSHFEVNSGLSLDDYQSVTKDRSLCQSIKQHLRLGVLARDYYDRAGIEFTGTWPSKMFTSKKLTDMKAVLSMGPQTIGTVEYDYYPRNTQNGAIQTYGIDTSEGPVIYIDFVKIEREFLGKRVDLQGNVGSNSPDSVSLVTMMMAEFLRQCFLIVDPKSTADPPPYLINAVFLYIASDKPTAALVAYANAGLYNDLIVTERVVDAEQAIIYTLPERQYRDSLYRPAEKRLRYRYDIVDVDPDRIEEDAQEWSVDRLGSPNTPNEPLRWVISQVANRASVKVITAQTTLSPRPPTKVIEMELGPVSVTKQPRISLYALLIREVLSALPTHYPGVQAVQININTLLQPSQSYIVGTLVHCEDLGLITEFQVIGNGQYRCTLTDRGPPNVPRYFPEELEVYKAVTKSLLRVDELKSDYVAAHLQVAADHLQEQIGHLEREYERFTQAMVPMVMKMVNKDNERNREPVEALGQALTDMYSKQQRMTEVHHQLVSLLSENFTPMNALRWKMVKEVSVSETVDREINREQKSVIDKYGSVSLNVLDQYEIAVDRQLTKHDLPPRPSDT